MKSSLRGPSIKYVDENPRLSDFMKKFLDENKDNESICGKLNGKELKLCELVMSCVELSSRLPYCEMIGVCMEPSFELLIVLCSLISCGIIYIPIEVKYPLEKMKYILNDSQPELIITDHISLFNEITKIETISYSQLMLKDKNEKKDDKLRGEDGFCLMYTSGSSGMIKGVYLSDQSLLNRLHWQWSKFVYEKNEICCLKTSISFVDSICEIFGPLFNVIPLVIIPKSILIEMNQFVEILFQERITRLICVPSFFTLLINYLINCQFQLPNLKLIICSGEILSSKLLKFYFENKRLFSFECRLLNLYGSTEVMGDVTYEIFEDEMNLSDNRVSIGIPIDNSFIEIINEDQNNIGELIVKGICVSNGYRSSREDLSQRFYKDENGIQSFNTGDRAKIINDKLFLYGRIDKQIKIGGNKVHLNEIEMIFEKEFNCVQPVVIYVEHRNEIVVFLEEKDRIGDNYRQILLKHLPISSIPKSVHYVKQFPYLVSGKIDQNQLIEFVFKEKSLEISEEDFLLKIFNEFGISSNDLDKNFFDSGGTSLTAIAFLSKLHQEGYSHVTFEELINAKQLKDLYQTLSISCEKRDEIVLLDHSFDRNELIQMISSSFIENAPIEMLIHNGDQQVKDELKEEWKWILNEEWERFVQLNLSFVIQSKEKEIVGIALSIPLEDQLSIHSNQIKYLKKVFHFIEQGENQFIDQLRQSKQFPKKVLRNVLTSVDPRLSSKEKSQVMFHLENHLINFARSNGFEGILSTNANPFTEQLAQLVFKYDYSIEFQLKEIFPNAHSNERISIQLKNLSSF